MFIVFFIPGTSSCVRRLHDINLSGKWLFLFYGVMFSVYGYLIYIFVSIAVMASQNPELSDVSEDQLWEFAVQHMSDEIVIILIILGINCISNIVFLILTLLRGTIGENKYGQPHDYIDRDTKISLHNGV